MPTTRTTPFSIGDVVKIEENRPISKLKRWIVVEDDGKAKLK